MKLALLLHSPNTEMLSGFFGKKSFWNQSTGLNLPAKEAGESP